jgi:hypothetical protein
MPPRQPRTRRHAGRSWRRAATVTAALLGAGCVRTPSLAPAPLRAPSSAETAIYRLIAESVYVRTTSRSVGIVVSPVDTSCASSSCPSLASRWGLDPLWWADGDSASALAERADLLARPARPLTLSAVPDGQHLLQSVDADSAAMVVAQPDTAHWTAFEDHHGGASGFVWFSPIGFDAQHQSAVVFADWRCGPFCGHTVTIALRATPNGVWQIADMLLVSSRAPRTGSDQH